MSDQATTRDEIRSKRPGLALAAMKGGRLAAIRLHCIECVGGSFAEASRCETSDCFLWIHGPAGRRARKESGQ
jgi:hypothetical protein